MANTKRDYDKMIESMDIHTIIDKIKEEKITDMEFTFTTDETPKRTYTFTFRDDGSIYDLLNAATYGEYDESNSDYYTNLLNIKDYETYYSSLDNAYEYNIDDNESSLIIEEENITFYLLNKYTEKNFSSIRISDKCLKKVQKIYNMENILIFMANIKVGNNISHQVEYLFYNSVPEFINDNIPLSLICQRNLHQSR